MARKKRADEVRRLYHLANNWTRKQWERTNQKGYEFAHDEQLSMDEKVELIQQKLRIISAEFQKMGPEINLGWEKPIATK